MTQLSPNDSGTGELVNNEKKLDLDRETGNLQKELLPRPTPESEEGMESRLKILYVDDEPVNLTNFSITLKKYFEVVTAASGAEALELFAAQDDIAMVVADQRMPGISGIELLTTIYRRAPHTIRIVLTGYTDLSDILAAINCGHVYQYIQKPWNDTELKLILSRAARTFMLTRHNHRLLTQLADKNLELERLNVTLAAANDQLSDDLVRWREAEEERLAIQLKMVNQAKLATLGQVAASMAHEINQPLSYIRIFLDAAKRDLKLQEQEDLNALEDVNEAIRQLSRISQIIDQLRTFARKEPSPLAQVDIAQVFDKAMILMGKQLKLKNIELIREIASPLPPVLGNASKFEQVFVNLLQNSLDVLASCPKKEIVLAIHAQEEQLIINFSDSGPGIPADSREKIFEPFYTTKSESEGTGLGLAIIAEIIEDHQGSITCRPVPGQGATFEIILPLAARG